MVYSIGRCWNTVHIVGRYGGILWWCGGLGWCDDLCYVEWCCGVGKCGGLGMCGGMGMCGGAVANVPASRWTVPGLNLGSRFRTTGWSEGDRLLCEY